MARGRVRRLLLVAAGISLVALSAAGYLGSTSWSVDDEIVRVPDDCPGIPPRHTTADHERADVVVPRATAPTVVDHASQGHDLVGALTDARAVLGGFDVLTSITLPSSGIEIEFRSDGPISIDEAELDALARLPLERHATFSDARVAALLGCYKERVMVERELDGTRLRVYVPSDHATCFSRGRLTRVGDGGYAATCDAAGFTVPGVPLSVRLMGREVLRLRNEATIVVSGASVEAEAAEGRAAFTLIHELMHHYDNSLGLEPWDGPLSHYEQRAYYVERSLRAALAAEGGPPRPIRYGTNRRR